MGEKTEGRKLDRNGEEVWKAGRRIASELKRGDDDEGRSEERWERDGWMSGGKKNRRW